MLAIRQSGGIDQYEDTQFPYLLLRQTNTPQEVTAIDTEERVTAKSMTPESSGTTMDATCEMLLSPIEFFATTQ